MSEHRSCNCANLVSFQTGVKPRPKCLHIYPLVTGMHALSGLSTRMVMCRAMLGSGGCKFRPGACRHCGGSQSSLRPSRAGHGQRSSAAHLARTVRPDSGSECGALHRPRGGCPTGDSLLLHVAVTSNRSLRTGHAACHGMMRVLLWPLRKTKTHRCTSVHLSVQGACA